MGLDLDELEKSLDKSLETETFDYLIEKRNNMKTLEEFLREQNEKDVQMYIEPNDYLYNLMEEYTKYVLKQVLTDVEENSTLTELLKRVEYIQDDSKFLETLESNGVDNWVGYSECYKRHINYEQETIN